MRTQRHIARSALHRAQWAALPHAARKLGAATVLMLPRPALGWPVAVRRHREDEYRNFAAVHGLSVEAYVSAVTVRLVAWATTARVRVRLELDVLPRFLNDGRYRNQFDTGTSGGALAPCLRLLVENVLLGIAPDAPANRRPVYGYLTGSHESHQNVIKYGDVVLELRRNVNHRTTFTFGDSLDEPAIVSPRPPFCPSPLSRPTIDGLDARFDAYPINEMWQATRCGYIEAQILGALTPTDVETAIFTLGTTPADSEREAMKASGIQWRTVPGNEP